MIYHKKCDHRLLIDLRESTKVLGDFSISGKFTAQINSITLFSVNSSRTPIVFYCRYCNEDVDSEDEMLCTCNGCGEIFEIKDIKVAGESGGIYCAKNCIKKFEKEEQVYSISIKDYKLPQTRRN